MQRDNTTGLMPTTLVVDTRLPPAGGNDVTPGLIDDGLNLGDEQISRPTWSMSTAMERLSNGSNEAKDYQPDYSGYVVFTNINTSTDSNDTVSLVVNTSGLIYPGLSDVSWTEGLSCMNSSYYNECIYHNNTITTTNGNHIHPHHPSQIQVTILDIFVAFVLSLFIICIIIGNILVISSVILFREMRTLTNVLIASLAIADLLVAIIVLPMSLHFEIMDHVWTLGPIVCDFWITSDVFCCTASILNIVVIAMDRYWLITRNVRYTHNARFPRKRVCLVMVSLAWVSSLVISVSPLFGWRSGSEKIDYTCLISQDLGYTVFSTFGAFWFPLSIILITYFKIFKVARKRARSRLKSRSLCPSINTSTLPTEAHNGRLSSMKAKRHSDNGGDITPPLPSNKIKHNHNPHNGSAQQQHIQADDSRGSAVSPVDESVCFVVKEDTMTSSHITVTTQNNNTYMETAINSILEEETCIEEAAQDNNHHQTHNDLQEVVPCKTEESKKPVTNGIHHSSSGIQRISATFTKKTSSSSSPTSYFRCKNRRQFQRLAQCRSSRMRRRNKMRSSARTLGLIIGCFVFCWMPFFLLASILPFCQLCSDNTPAIVQSITLWLGYSNSLLNPAIYAIWDKNFRRSFKKVIQCHINWSYVFYN